MARRRHQRRPKGTEVSPLLFRRLRDFLLYDVVAWLPGSALEAVEATCKRLAAMLSEKKGAGLLRIRRFEVGCAEEGIIALVAPKNSIRPVWDVVGITPGFGKCWRRERTRQQPDAAIAALEHELFVVGGQPDHVAHGAMATVKCYDARDDEWFDLPPLKHARRRCGCAFVDGRLVVAGGLDADCKPVLEVEIFDPDSQSWGSLPSLPVHAWARDGGEFVPSYFGRSSSLLVVGKKLFLLNTAHRICHLFCLHDAQTWRECSPMPEYAAPYLCHQAISTVVFDRRIYVILQRHTGDTTMVEGLRVYDPDLDDWTAKSRPPTLDSYGTRLKAPVCPDGRGRDDSTQFLLVLRDRLTLVSSALEAAYFDPNTETWTSPTPLIPHHRYPFNTCQCRLCTTSWTDHHPRTTDKQYSLKLCRRFTDHNYLVSASTLRLF
ncbi:hypothetical protein CTAYLR_000963 [Chrysophaeum taylorii]|uniref:Uncharacterized protein n=1 Tax=Chrysophaeum taylorii TaxID=2483200 RepID=A0AAD7XJH8_9STRA|nr:hypothetical protein CTAYLR_000963 [Chrysophaeum taylorii]